MSAQENEFISILRLNLAVNLIVGDVVDSACHWALARETVSGLVSTVRISVPEAGDVDISVLCFAVRMYLPEERFLIGVIWAVLEIQIPVPMRSVSLL